MKLLIMQFSPPRSVKHQSKLQNPSICDDGIAFLAHQFVLLMSGHNHQYHILKLAVCILLRVLGQVQGFRLTQHWFEYFIQ
jgi:hypothetical protein